MVDNGIYLIDIVFVIKQGAWALRRFSLILLLVTAVILGYSTESGFSLGDRVFKAVSLPTWSHGYTGTHYAAIFSIILFGIAAVDKAFSSRKLALIILLCLVFIPPIALQGKAFYFGIHRGLQAVEYNVRDSHFEIASSTDGNVQVTGTVVLTNHGKTPISFGIKLPIRGYLQNEQPTELSLTGPDGLEKTGIFRIEPQQTKTIVINTTTLGNGAIFGHETLNGPELLIYNESEKLVVGFNK